MFEYRLGDLVNLPFHITKPWAVCTHMPESIGCEYMKLQSKLNMTRTRNHDLLEEIVRKRVAPAREAFVAVHIRLGDTLDTPPYSYWCRRDYTKGCLYAYPPHFYEELHLPRLPIVIYTSIDKGMQGKAAHRSQAFLTNVSQVLRPATIHMRRQPDHDFLDMMSATILVAHARGGQFASLLRRIAPRFNVTVLPR